MSRDDGFSIADIDTGYLDDEKVRRLWRQLGDQGRMAQAVVIHQATLLASWRAGCRVPVAESMPLWLLVSDPALVAELQRAHLLDSSERIPARSWHLWFGPALRQRKRHREWNRRSDARRAGAQRCNHRECARRIRELVWESHPHVCYLCGTAVAQGVNLHLDHVVPLAHGGIHCAKNLRPSCSTCNLRKGARL